MTVQAGSTILAADVIDSSAGAADVGKIPKLNSLGKLHPTFFQAVFGGDGSDGALSISSGTTTIDLGNAEFVVKNYTSISITGTGKLAFSNPHTNGTTIVLKSQGNVTLTSSQAPMIDASGMGGQGAASTAIGTNSSGSGTSGNAGLPHAIYKSNFGTGGQTAGSVGVGGATPVVTDLANTVFKTSTTFGARFKEFFLGAGAGSGIGFTGSTTTATTGEGGDGGGALFIECAGAWNFTTAGGISVAGTNGGTAVLGGTPNGNSLASGGGGGGGGYCCVLYNILTANSGTITISGGTGGSNSTKTGVINNMYGGGGGGGLTAGSDGSNNATAAAKTGGDGGTGYSLVAQNIIYT